MILTITNKIKLDKLHLPNDIMGSYPLFDRQGNVIAIVFDNNGAWNIKPNDNNKLSVNGTLVSSTPLNNFSMCVITTSSNENYYIYSYPTTIPQKTEVTVKKYDITIGSGSGSNIFYSTNMLASHHATLHLKDNTWYIEAHGASVYVNQYEVKKKRLYHGDIVFMCGLKIVPIGKKLVIYNLIQANALKLDGTFEQVKTNFSVNPESLELSTERTLYQENEYFSRAPRFKSDIEPKTFTIAPPPEFKERQTQPEILTIGPQMTMMLTSSLTMFTSLSSVASGQAKLSQVLPTFIVSVLTIVSSFMWPTLTRKWSKRQARKEKIKSEKDYDKYLDEMEKRIAAEIGKEKQVALENNITLEECQEIIYKRKRTLWERQISEKDFLTVNIGVGSIEPRTKIEYDKSKGISSNLILQDKLDDLIKRFEKIDNVPVPFSLIENNMTAVIGTNILTQSFINSILLQCFTYQSYTDFKVVVFTNALKENNWDYLRSSVHCWDNQKTIRFIGTNLDDIKTIGNYVLSDLQSRIPEEQNGAQTDPEKLKNIYKSYVPYYLIIIDDLEMVRNLDVVKTLLGYSYNLGYSIIIKNDRISNLPNKINTFLNIDENISGLFRNLIVSSNQKEFKALFNKTIDMEGCVQALANIPIHVEKAKYELPKSISFLSMFNVGRIEALNSLDRWKNNNPVNSLAVPVGIDQNGDLFMMDAHEKAYGPHGLVAGTTGSGKSEWIITYILSLAVNFNPYEVQFVLIDYKGGGLAGSFENKELGIKLPHVVATITNLDKSEIRRSIASIEAELKRRQRLFNEAREKLKDSSMNIYKYQDYYRKGLLDEPMSHLYIISDEFAELKSQEPEFMDQLISTARIGRSLGVHLILATQKPSGVVDDQIWSNARFHVALRVQDKQDSNDMIKTPDAAYLKTTGSFYLQVGNDEFYGLGQSAYAGYKYIPSDVIKKEIDTDIHFINQIGAEIHVTTSVTQEQLAKSQGEDQGEQLLNIVKYCDGLAKQKQMNIKKLWLDRIPDIIFIDALKKKYNYVKENFNINPVIGEYDDPYTQSQHIMTLPISEYGNVGLYGKTGSGKELFIQSLVYSLTTTYTIQELEIYILDFGAEILRSLEANPIVGNVVTINEVDKIDGVLKYVLNRIAERKMLFADYGGNYDQFIKTSGKAVPHILIILNNFTTFYERYPDMTDVLNEILRDCTKYGISFLIANSTKMYTKTHEALSYKMTFNCENDEDYRDFIDAPNNFLPADGKCRGLCEINKVFYEFQGAIPTVEEKMNELIKQVNLTLTNAYKTAVPSVPYLPHIITFDTIKDQVTDLKKVPLGISKVRIKTEFVNLMKHLVFYFISKNTELIEETAINVCRILNTVNDDGQIVIMDATQKLDEYITNEKVAYVNDGFDEIINNLYVYTKKAVENFDPKADPYEKKHKYIVIRGIQKFVGKLSRESLQYLAYITNNAPQLKTMSFIFIDTYSDFREYGSEDFMIPFKDFMAGLWVGNGVSEQSMLDVTKYDIRPGNGGVADNIGFIVENSRSKMVKVIEEPKDEEE